MSSTYYHEDQKTGSHPLPPNYTELRSFKLQAGPAMQKENQQPFDFKFYQPKQNQERRGCIIFFLVLLLIATLSLAIDLGVMVHKLDSRVGGQNPTVIQATTVAQPTTFTAVSTQTDISTSISLSTINEVQTVTLIQTATKLLTLLHAVTITAECFCV